VATEFEIEIVPPSRWGTFNWQELWRYRELFMVLAWRDIAVRYKQTLLGALWAIIQPFVAMVLFTGIFNSIGHIEPSSSSTPYSVFVYLGLLLWQFYSNTLTNASNSIVGNAAMMQKVYFPRLMLPIAAMTTAVVDMLVAALPLLVLMGYYHIHPSDWLAALVVLPISVLVLIATSLGWGLGLAALNVKYRDVRYALPFLIQASLYVTPVIYPSSALPQLPLALQVVIWCNPLTGAVSAARAVLINDGSVNPAQLALAALLAVLSLVVGLLYFRGTERYFADVA
jgi:lipopolysaccharide transport system permease protein